MSFKVSCFTALVLSIMLTACSDNKAYETALCAMADTSGTYADEKANVARIIKAGVISEMTPGDSLIIVTIDSNSYKEENLKSTLKLDYIPSNANQQKLAFANKLDEFSKDPDRSDYTDISGAMMLCADYLESTGSGNQAMLIFSDMKEELKDGLVRDFSGSEFDGMHIAAMNVIKLDADSVDPAVYRKRLHDWEQRVKQANATSWKVIIDPVKIPEYIDQLR